MEFGHALGAIGQEHLVNPLLEYHWRPYMSDTLAAPLGLYDELWRNYYFSNPSPFLGYALSTMPPVPVPRVQQLGLSTGGWPVQTPALSWLRVRLSLRRRASPQVEVFGVAQGFEGSWHEARVVESGCGCVLVRRASL